MSLSYLLDALRGRGSESSEDDRELELKQEAVACEAQPHPSTPTVVATTPHREATALAT